MNKYKNYDGIKNKHTFSDFLRWIKEKKTKKKDYSYRVQQAEKKEIDFLKNNREQTTITWVGHSTFLIQIGGLNILTDPIWADRLAFYKRSTEPGLKLEELPLIDIVLVSHSHYDHLDFSTILKLPPNIVFLVPSGLKKLFIRKHIIKSEELKWWTTFKWGIIEFTFVPSQHWSKRTLFDTNTSHWGGWVMRNTQTNETIYFAGDSGYFRGFEEIGERFKSIDYALLPIGAYEPEFFLKMDHMNPEEAIQSFCDVKAKTFIPMHYGAYKLANETTKECLDRLYAEWEKQKLDLLKLKVLLLGETLHSEENLNENNGEFTWNKHYKQQNI
ncbi:MBL fold metallo-hydrolase [Aneurinibacillus sp. Ricciae_BoGa-3]|nr:MBL fold metallo-hydrolase [Aneurinibacillus sp. Ricciae_BoGa-3]WCK52544.1 MBL fold metallo-hydrolase [Aneurinibacillus sp. Ricciae_BoGa-3]